MRLGLTAFAGLLLLASGAVAQDSICQHQPGIVSLADSIIEKREDLSGFPKRNFGTDAAFLKIRYEPLADDEAEALLAQLIAGKARGIRDLAFAWSYGRGGGEVTLRLLGGDAIQEAVSTSNVSGMRAMVEAGDEARVMEAIAALPKEVTAPHMLITAAIDLPDRTKTRLLEFALAKDLPILAAGLAATLRKAKGWGAFLKTLNDPELVEQATLRWRWAPALVNNPRLPPLPAMPSLPDLTVGDKLHQISIAAAMEPQFDFMLTLFNQTGRLEEIAAAARAVTEAVESGTVARDGFYGPAWLIVYRVLRENWRDMAGLESQLGSFRLNTGTAGGSSPLELLDVLIAVEALGPHVRDETDELPAAPSELSADFAEWARWLEIAARVKANPGDPTLAEEGGLPVATELLLAAGRSDDLSVLVAGQPATSPLMHLATDVAIRLDRMCESYLAHPTEAHQLKGQQVYKFER